MTPTRALEIRAAAEALLHDMPLATPVNVEMLCAQNNVHIHYAKLDPSLSGFTFIAARGPVITLNQARNRNRQRFTLAHELGHIVMHRAWLQTVIHAITEFRIARPRGKSLAPLEALHEEANIFALELLLPDALLDGLHINGWDIEETSDLTAQAERFEVNVETLRHRLLTRN